MLLKIWLQVFLETRVPICNGILRLDSKTVTILGGLVQSLYEEWQMSQKYSGFSRSSLISSKNSDGVGPPPFEKFQIGKQPHQVPWQQGSHDTYSRQYQKLLFPLLHADSNFLFFITTDSASERLLLFLLIIMIIWVC